MKNFGVHWYEMNAFLLINFTNLLYFNSKPSLSTKIYVLSGSYSKETTSSILLVNPNALFVITKYVSPFSPNNWFVLLHLRRVIPFFFVLC